MVDETEKENGDDGGARDSGGAGGGSDWVRTDSGRSSDSRFDRMEDRFERRWDRRKRRWEDRAERWGFEDSGGGGRDDRDDGGRSYDHSRRSISAIGLMLVLVGIFFLVAQWTPDLRDWLRMENSWPLTIVGVAIFLLLIGLVTLTPDLVIPASIVGGVGGLLFWQNATGNWGTWSYAWTFIPGFVGVGLLLAGLLRGPLTRRGRGMITGGFSNIFVSMVLFAIFGSFLGGPQWLVRYWPVAIILFGLWVLVRPRRRPHRRRDWDDREWRDRDDRDPRDGSGSGGSSSGSSDWTEARS